MEILILKEKIIEDKVEFKFTSNYSSGDYLLNYWIEDYSGEVVYLDKNSNFLETSSFFVLLGLMTLMIPMLIFW